MSKEDPFEEIVRHLDLDLSFPEPERAPEPPPQRAPKQRTPAPDEEFYRKVSTPPPRHMKHSHLMAWLGIIGGPVTIMLASMAHVILPRPVLLAIALLFVAGAIFLISQLPERGPAEPDWPDDGAQL
jgi:hypothetical protein